jgi:hypothetical protein
LDVEWINSPRQRFQMSFSDTTLTSGGNCG